MKKLYKYRRFGVHSLKELCDSEVYYADPNSFNDPLDCSPELINDIELDELENLFLTVMNRYHKKSGEKQLRNCQYLSTEYGDYKTNTGIKKHYMNSLIRKIKNGLDSEMKNRGVLSLASKWNCPLMWSHYADEHKGICIEYDISRAVCDVPTKIDYNGGRGIPLSSIVDWIFNDSIEAKEAIERKYFYTKAGQWKYEKEWRYLSGSHGARSAPFPISGIYFGMRCENSIVSSIVKLLDGHKSDINFYQVRPKVDSFILNKHEVDVGELVACTPRMSAALAFGDLT